MFSRFIKSLIVVTVLISCSGPKKIVKTDTATLDSLKVHINYLADDKLEGRRTGTAGEQLAAQYISAKFQSIGLLPKGSSGYVQPFEIKEGKIIGKGTDFAFGGEHLSAGTDFFPFPYSANIKMEAEPSISVQEADMPWFFDLKDVLDENKTNPHFDLKDYIRTNAKKAAGKGASAVILYNTSTTDDKLAFDGKDRTDVLSIPVIYLNKEVAAKYLNDPSATIKVFLAVEIAEKKRTGANVVGYINNGATNTVILGAHFDHLGYGEDGNSRNTSKTPAIHNGADDNASGTAALIELARKLKTSKAKNNNYLFIAFSGEELGLYGSKYFTENPTIDLKSANYMINMDMVGRLNDSTKTLTIGGFGTSPTWSSVISTQPGTAFSVKVDSSGTGPSDHTSFYRKDIPVLFYFTGLHTDYHTPNDDADKINYDGIVKILENITGVITSLNESPKLAFTKTREAQTTTSARFSVSMGIMPDYTFSGNGVKADGVSEGKPAQKAGLKAGDIIQQLGDYTISSMESYMQALGKFKKGDKAKVKYKRGNEVLETTVEF